MTVVVCKQCTPPRQFNHPPALASHIRSAHPAVPGNVPPPLPSNGLHWEDPPERRSGSGARLVDRFRSVVPDLKRRPGSWLRWNDYKSATTANSQAKRLREAFPDIEIIGRRVDPSGSAIFARYVEG